MAADASGPGIPFGWALAIIIIFVGTPECTAILPQQPDN